MIAFIRWLRGYYLLKISGYSPERFFNLCKINNIVLWNFYYQNSEYYCYIKKSNYDDIIPFLDKTQTTAELIWEKGFIYTILKYKKRLPYFLGTIICVFMLYGLSFFIWSFEIDGNDKVSDELIIRFLKDEGIYYGRLKNNIDIAKIEDQIREYFHHISWVSVKIDGTRLYVSLKEIDTSKIEKENNISVPKHIYADISGEILWLVTRKGTPRVKEGDMVSVGDLMIEGTVPIFDDTNNLLHQHDIVAEGDYIIRTNLNINREISRYYRFKEYTGHEYTVRYLRLGNQYFCSDLLRKKYINSEIKEEEFRPVVFEKLDLPIYYGKRRYIEYIEKEELYEEKEAKILLNNSIDHLIKELSEKGVQIIEKNVKIEIDHQKIMLYCDFVIDVMREY